MSKKVRADGWIEHDCMSYKEALAEARKISSELEYPRDFVSRQRCRVVTWLHADGSRFEVNSAAVRKFDDYIAIFTEHHGDFVYHIDDLDWVKEHWRPKHIYYNKDNSK